MDSQTSILWRIWLATNPLLILAAMMGLTSQRASAATYLRNETDRLALLEFKRLILDDPTGVLNSWNDSQHHCKWQGVTCNARHQRVNALTLRGKSLFGSISPHIGNLSFLKFMLLGENKFYGEIPQEVGYLFRLRTLNLTGNRLSGEIPVNFSQCLELRLLYLKENRLEGKIPIELGSLKKLVRLILSRNNLTGGIPPAFGNLSSIQALSLAFNQLEGSLPEEMGSLTSLSYLNIDQNNFRGIIPPSIYNISSISSLGATSNALYGQLPANLGQILPNLEQFYMGGNQFSGNIPISLANASKLEEIEFSDNNLEGQVPNDLGVLPNLQLLNIELNRLGGNSVGDLGFIASLSNCSSLYGLSFDTNNFGGELPNHVANLSFQLNKLHMGKNNIVGTIPVGLGSLANLYVLDLEDNYFSGTLPSDFGKLQKLQGLYLSSNRLSGPLPSSFCNITSLYLLDLSGNRFEGNIPPCVGKFHQLMQVSIGGNNFSGIMPSQLFDSHFSPIVLELSYNSLSGSLPLEIGKFVNMDYFSVAFNKFSGEIPITLGNCKTLMHLDMHGNLFDGTIPRELASLKGIQYLDLSLNNLTGKVSRDLEKLSSLKYLNLSFNELEGEIPTKGVFGNASQIILVGNSIICGGIPELKLSPCPFREKKKGKHLIIVVTSTVFSVILISVTLTSLYIVYQKRFKKKVSSAESSRVNKILRISFHDLHRATIGFSPENLIGSGSFGSVYKGRLEAHGNKLVAVKVLDLQKTGASTSFKAECKALRNIRHRNLVTVLTYCSSIDFRGQEFKALVYEFMEKGSLDMWLHPEMENRNMRNLNLLQRLNIAIDVASAVHYLHNHCGEATVIHCDLKPSNILLDNEFAAHVGDFGLAKILPMTTKSSSEQGTSSTIAIKGSIGYAAPEYGMGSEASTQGDVYSYGILLLEMFTGRRPTDDAFIDGFDLHNYVQINLQEHVLKIADLSLLSELGGDGIRPMEPNDHGRREIEEISEGFVQLLGGKENLERFLISIFMVGLKCSAKSPRDRMNMNEVIRELHQINDGFFGVQIRKSTPHV